MVLQSQYQTRLWSQRKPRSPNTAQSTPPIGAQPARRIQTSNAALLRVGALQGLLKCCRPLISYQPPHAFKVNMSLKGKAFFWYLRIATETGTFAHGPHNPHQNKPSPFSVEH